MRAARIEGQTTESGRITLLVELFAHGEEPMRELALAVRRHDIQWRVWRQTHAALVAGMIGQTRPGTGGTAGYPYLAEKARLRWYHELHVAYALIERGKSV